uniref:ATPase family AAA domain containing 1a n=1 Tax=Sinocyclocheilus rhinocerous TaxID=307959 RepID=A0A673H165_9TELE
MLSDIPRDALLRPLTWNEVVGMLVRPSQETGKDISATGCVLKVNVIPVKNTFKFKYSFSWEPAERLMKQIGVEGVSLTEYEMNIATHLVDPRSINVTWRDVAGLDELISELQDTVILSFQKRHLFRGSKLLQPPKGVLLYGPPGCGKTLIAKASGCRFINLQASTLTDKWYDSFLRNRSSMDHEATAMMKAQFMSLWDGLDTSSSSQVMVMGATNRPQDVDAAILRRMPTTFHVGLPVSLLNTHLYTLYLLILSNAINLKEILCRDAAMYRVRDYVRKQQMKQIAQQLQLDEEEHVDSTQLRPVTQQDLLFGLDKMRESKQATATADPANLREVPLD